MTIKSPSIHKSKTWHLYVNVLCYSLAITRILVCFANPDRTGEDEPTHDNCSPSNLCIVANMADMTNKIALHDISHSANFEATNFFFLPP